MQPVRGSRGDVRRALVVLLAAALAIGVALLLRHRRAEEAPEPAGNTVGTKTDAPGSGPKSEEEPPAAVRTPQPAARRSSKISGVVLHDDGTPAEGRRVVLRPEKRPDKWPCPWWFERDARVAKDGRFAFAEVVFEDKLEVVATTCDPKTSPRWTGTLVPGTDAEGLVLRLPRAIPFVVTVVNVHGAVVEGSAVRVWPGELGDVLTGSDGTARFELDGVAEVGALAMPPGGGRLRFIETVAWYLPVSRGGARITLEAAGVASGIVLTPEGEPAAGVLILVKRQGPAISTATSGADGRFECAVALDRPVGLVVEPSRNKAPMLRGPDGKDRRVQGALGGVSAGDTGLQLQLEWVEEASLVVIVVSPDGEPVAGATVWAYEQQVSGTRSAVSGADGRATFEGLPRVNFSVTVEPPNTPDAADWMVGMGNPGGVEPGEEPEEVELVRGCRLNGLILRPDGSPAGGARLTLSADASCCHPWTPPDGYPTGPDGRFSFLVAPGVAQDLTLRGALDAERLHGERTIDARDVKEDVIVQLVRDP